MDRFHRAIRRRRTSLRHAHGRWRAEAIDVLSRLRPPTAPLGLRPQVLPEEEPPLPTETDIPPDMILRTGWPVSGCFVSGSSFIPCRISNRIAFFEER